MINPVFHVGVHLPSVVHNTDPTKLRRRVVWFSLASNAGNSAGCSRPCPPSTLARGIKRESGTHSVQGL